MNSWQNHLFKIDKSIHYSSAYFIPKPNDQPRLMCDYRLLNENTKREHYPYPDVRNIFLDIHGSDGFLKKTNERLQSDQDEGI